MSRMLMMSLVKELRDAYEQQMAENETGLCAGYKALALCRFAP